VGPGVALALTARGFQPAQQDLPDAAWHHLTVCTDRDDATAADRDPLGAASR
jgi:hypothetical protein